jgi:hypothetical protein
MNKLITLTSKVLSSSTTYKEHGISYTALGLLHCWMMHMFDRLDMGRSINNKACCRLIIFLGGTVSIILCLPTVISSAYNRRHSHTVASHHRNYWQLLKKQSMRKRDKSRHIKNLDSTIFQTVIRLPKKGGPGASGRVLPPVTGRSRVRVAVSSHYTGEGKACHWHPSPDPTQSGSSLHWVRRFFNKIAKRNAFKTPFSR